MGYFLVLLLLCIASLEAKDLGIHGTVYPILEEDLLSVINQRLSSLKGDKFSAIQKKWMEHQNNALVHPRGRELAHATRYRCAYFDPSILSNSDILDHQGHAIVKKGQKYNPLEHYNLSKPLLFFDGNDPNHVIWAKKQKGKWILTKGRPLELELKEKHPVYFDQGGYLTRKLGIQAIPSIVSQDSLKLKLEEFPIEAAL